ncbi:MAG: efflux RND transporter permease subunit, partial [Phycisphaerae bacterium]|nr:efflux RND transporter permease subunit [Phycisphaerae bacterium]
SQAVLERAEGVSEIQILGGREREAQVRVDLAALAARGITIEQLVNALTTENRNATAGTVDEGKRAVSVRVVGQYESPDQIADTVIAYTSAGAPVYVRDVARIVLDFKKETGFVNSLGEKVMAINAQRETGSNVLSAMASLKAAVADVNENVLKPKNWGIMLDQVYDQTIYINDAVSNAGWNLLLGAVLAGIVLLLTLRSLGATLVIMVAIPISIVGTLVGMAVLGRSLNVISMAGLTFAVGMGIDNAIVVLENIFRHREMGKDRIRAALDGALEVWGAVVAATLTNVAVFLPVIFIQEDAGQLFRDLSVALTISFFLYLFVAPTVIPMLATLFLRNVPLSLREDRPRETRLGHATAFVGRLQASLNRAFYTVVHYLTGGFLRRAVLVVVLVTVSIWLCRRLMPPTDYLPRGNQNLIFGFVLPPPGYGISEYRKIAQIVEDQLRPWWQAKQKPETLPALQEQYLQGIRNYAIPAIEKAIAETTAKLKSAGASPEQIAKATAFQQGMAESMRRAAPPPAIDNFFFVNFGNFVFMGASSVDRFNVAPLASLMNSTLSGIPGTSGFFQQASIFRDTTPGGVLELSVYGPDDALVRRSAGAMMGALAQTFQGQPRPDPSNFDLGRDEVRVKVDSVRASAAGVNGGAAIRSVVQAAVDGVVVGDYRLEGDSIDLTVVSDVPRDARSREQLADIPLAGRNGTIVPLGNVATFEVGMAPQQINRTEEQSSVTFSVQLPEGMTIGEAVSAVQEQIEPELRRSGALPPSISIKLKGSAGKLQQFLEAFLPGFILAGVITYLLLAALYENFLHPVTIILTLPFAMVGGFAALGILHAFVP